MEAFSGIWGFPGGLAVKNLPAMQETQGNMGLISGLGRSPERRHGNPSQYSCLENPHGQRSLLGLVHRVAKSQTLLND